MAVAKNFTCTINAEGPSQVHRAKVPSGMINQMGGQAGDVIEFELVGKTLVGGHILRGRKADEAKLNARTQSRSDKPATPRAPVAKVKAPAPKAQPKVAAKIKAPAKPLPKLKVPAAKPAKSNKTKTSVPMARPKLPAVGSNRVLPKIKR